VVVVDWAYVKCKCPRGGNDILKEQNEEWVWAYLADNTRTLDLDSESSWTSPSLRSRHTNDLPPHSIPYQNRHFTHDHAPVPVGVALLHLPHSSELQISRPSSCPSMPEGSYEPVRNCTAAAALHQLLGVFLGSFICDGLLLHYSWSRFCCSALDVCLWYFQFTVNPLSLLKTFYWLIVQADLRSAILTVKKK
jgi:hypothetical protein